MAIEWEFVFFQKSVIHLFPRYATPLPSQYQRAQATTWKHHAFSTSKIPHWRQRDSKYFHILMRATNNWAKELSSGLNWLYSAYLSCQPHIFQARARLGEVRGSHENLQPHECNAHSESPSPPLSPFHPFGEEAEDAKNSHWSLGESSIGCRGTYSKDIWCCPHWLDAVDS